MLCSWPGQNFWPEQVKNFTKKPKNKNKQNFQVFSKIHGTLSAT